MFLDRSINGTKDVKFLECDYLLVLRCEKLTLVHNEIRLNVKVEPLFGFLPASNEMIFRKNCKGFQNLQYYHVIIKVKIIFLFSGKLNWLNSECFVTYRTRQGLIPSQKVHFTCQLVKKILGWSSEKSYHESWD